MLSLSFYSLLSLLLFSRCLLYALFLAAVFSLLLLIVLLFSLMFFSGFVFSVCCFCRLFHWLWSSVHPMAIRFFLLLICLLWHHKRDKTMLTQWQYCSFTSDLLLCCYLLLLISLSHLVFLLLLVPVTPKLVLVLLAAPVLCFLHWRSLLFIDVVAWVALFICFLLYSIPLCC